MGAEQMLTVRQVAERLAVNQETVRRWLRSGELEGILLGGTKTGYRIPESAVGRFLNAKAKIEAA